MLRTWFLRAALAGIVTSLLAVILTSCSSGGTKGPASSIPANNPTGPVKGTTIDVRVTGDSVTIPLNKVTTSVNTRFKLATSEGEMTFMAYVWDGELHVRADICPPCRSKSFTLTKGTLVCDSCGTVFDAVSGKGRRGACIAYPKESADYQLSGESIVVSKADLVSAYRDTLTPN